MKKINKDETEKEMTVDELAGIIKNSFDAVDKRFDKVDSRIDGLENTVGHKLDDLSIRLTSVEKRLWKFELMF